MSDPFADVNIDEDIDILNHGSKVRKDYHRQALKLLEDDRPEGKPAAPSTSGSSGCCSD